MYEGHTNALTAVLVFFPARWAGVALQPLSVPFGPAGLTHACRHNLDVAGGYIYTVDHCTGPQFRCSGSPISNFE
jgi:hypothetical protein